MKTVISIITPDNLQNLQNFIMSKINMY